MPACEHLDLVRVAVPETTEGCEDCLAGGDSWLHLRVCRTCGKVGCCDSSPNQHASKHAKEANHPVISSAEPSEDWSYCFIEDVAFILPGG